MSLAIRIKAIDLLKQELDKKRPLPKETLKQLKEYYRIGLTYTSNAVEGNTLTESETKVLLEDGLTVGGKPLKDSLEALGHSSAFDYIYELKDKNDLTEADINRIHDLFYYRIDNDNSGKYRTVKVFISGTTFIPPSPSLIPGEMKKFIKNLLSYTGNKHPVETAIFAHRELVRIHPYIDGNGRSARLLMNLFLIKYGYAIAVIPPILRSEYIQNLCTANEEQNNEPFDCFIADRIFEAMKELTRLLK